MADLLACQRSFFLLSPKPLRYLLAMPATRKSWTRDELLIALNLYHKLTFGQLHSRNPAIIALADKLDRGANSVAMKLNNFASLDPVQQLRGIKGLQGAGALDRSIWTEFHEAPSEAVADSEDRLRTLFGADAESEVEVIPKEGIRVMRVPFGPTAVSAAVKIRRGQSYFRNVVLNNFGGCCGVTRLDIRELLIASHILPWGKYPQERLNVRNGLCLSRLHDAAFDMGLIAFDDNLRLLLSPRLKDALPQKIVADTFGAYVGQPLLLPADAIPPDPEFLRRHRQAVKAW
jgi:putative restriction endonuclease